MDYFKGTKIQISPCIAAKAKYALNISNKISNNTKKCSFDYWCKVIETIASNNNLSRKTLEDAKCKFNSLIS